MWSARRVMALPNLSALPIAVCTATSSEDERQVKRARIEAEAEAEKDLVLVLGGIAYHDLTILPINRFYARLAEDLRATQHAVEVILVDPEEWKHGDRDGVTTHHRMTLAEYVLAYPPEELLSKYRRVAIVDDIKFEDYRLRQAILTSPEHKRLVAVADANKDRVAWWEFYRLDGDHGEIVGIREINHIRRVPLLSPIAVVILGMQMERLVRDGTVKRFCFGEAPAPEGLLAELFTTA